MPNNKKNKKRSNANRKSRWVKKNKGAHGAAKGAASSTGSGAMTIVGISMISKWDPLPPRFICKFRYQSTKKFTVAAGTFGLENLYRLNSLYDPDFTGAGDYPYAFPTFQSLYKTYRVHGVLVEVLFTDPSVDGLIGGVLVQPSTSPATLAGETIDTAGARPMVATVALNFSGSQTALVRQYLSIAAIDGIPKAQLLGDPNYQAQTNTSPVSTPFLRVAIACEDLANNTATAYIQVRLIFDCALYDRILL
jgi:hypothetical protein